MGNRQVYKLVVGVFFLAAICLRLLLFWANPPDNYFDDHFEPIYRIMEDRSIPSKEACWECFQPPLFYLISAAVGNTTLFDAEMDLAQQLKLFQFLPCLYGILTVYIVYLILKRVDISDYSRTLAFGMVCFLPRHIYMSAIHSNDSLSYLLVTFAAYLMLVVIDRRFPAANSGPIANLSAPEKQSFTSTSRAHMPELKSFLLLFVLMVTILLALFTKSTSLVLIPTAAYIFLIAFARRWIAIDRRSAAAFTLVVILPVVVVGSTVMTNLKNYGEAFPLNIELRNVSLTQPPGSDDLSFSSFKPWTTIKTPILAPGNVESFWTLIFSRMWFDMEPLFLQYSDPDIEWWDAYDDYLNRHDRYDWPGDIALSSFTRFSGSTLIALGLLPLVLILIGFTRAMFGKWSLWSKIELVEILKVQLFVSLLLLTLAGIILHAYGHPYYSFMKAAFVLSALPAFALFLGLGLMTVEKVKAVRWGVSIVFGFTFLLTTIHIAHIVQSLSSGLS